MANRAHDAHAGWCLVLTPPASATGCDGLARSAVDRQGSRVRGEAAAAALLQLKVLCSLARDYSTDGFLRAHAGSRQAGKQARSTIKADRNGGYMMGESGWWRVGNDAPGYVLEILAAARPRPSSTF
ncbi:hypothetical protein EDC01DRAFT_775467 [Geopyxis carbonaria]|nr:hypothetical protein EDC01DRAFT_775467 [Geopyxis carbonaria]